MAVASDIAGTASERKRAAKVVKAMADERPLVDRLYSLWHELRAAGWQDMLYAPKDGSDIEMIEMGSTGVFRARWRSYSHEPLDTCGCFFGEDGGNAWPMRGVMWRPIKPKKID